MSKVLDPIKNSVKGITDLWKDDQPDDFIEDEEMSLLEHLEEMRSRIVKMAIALVVMAVIGAIFATAIIALAKEPAPESVQWIFIDPTENFVTYFKVAILTGAGLATPIFLWQVIGFVSPGLTRREKRLLFSMLPLVGFFFLVGAAFGYYVTLPFALRYLLTFGTDYASAAIRISSYISFVMTILLWMGLSFELPVIIYVLSALRIVTPRRLASFRKYAILIFFVIAAIITPTPDPLNQAFVAVPMIVLYEVGILMARTVKPPAPTP